MYDGAGSRSSMPAKAWGYLFHLAATVATVDEKRQCLELLDTYRFVSPFGSRHYVADLTL
jgi:hypothetical protein